MRKKSPSRILACLAGATALAACGERESGGADFDELAHASLAQIDGSLTVDGLTADVEVLRDEWGIAHIYAQNTDDLFFAQGYVQAQDRLWQIDMWRRVNEGRLAEILGPEAFEHDKLARLLMYRGPWDEEWTSYHPNGKAIFEAFANGVNAYIDQIGDNLPVEYKVTGLRPLRWTPEASTGRVATALPLRAARAELQLARQVAELGADEANRRAQPDPWNELRIPDGLDVSIIPEAVGAVLGEFRRGFPKPPLLPEYQGLPGAVASLNQGAVETSPGSNNWVVSGRLTASGQVLLANDPHRQVTNPSLRYLIHLNAPGYSVIGATEPAIPGVAIGHNGKVAWGLTIVGTDQADIFVEELNPDNLNEARWNDEWYPLRIQEETIAIREEEPRSVELKFSRHGPIFYVDSTNHVAYALRSTSTEPGTGGYLAALRIADVDNCREFLDDAMAYYKAPTENMICGDAGGNIGWLAAALTPRRKGGWYGRLPVPGTGRFEWDGFRSHTELPQEYNPERGWIATANHNILPPGYEPPLFFKRAPYSRWDRLQQMFADVADLTPDDFERMLHDAVYPYIDEDLPLFGGWTSEDADLEWARSRLAAWDGVYDKDEAAPALHNVWRSSLSEEARLPGTGAAERGALSEAALALAVEELRSTQGGDREQWRWGRMNRSEFPHSLVSAYDLGSVERSGSGGTVAARGATFRHIVDFADLDNSRGTSTPGQSGQPGSPYYGNLLSFWGNQEFFPLLYTREAVEGRAAHRQTLGPGGP